MDTHLPLQKKSISTDSSNADGYLQPQQLYRRDPLLRFFKSIQRDSWIVLGVTLLTTGAELCWVLVAKHSFDPLRRMLETAISPLCFAVYLILPNSVCTLFNTLKADGIISIDSQDTPKTTAYQHFLDELVSWLDCSWWASIAFILSLLFVVLSVLSLYYSIWPVKFLITQPLPQGPLWLQIATIVITAFNFYAIAMGMVKLIIVFTFSNRLFSRFDIEIKVYHRDGAGGLGMLSSMLWLCLLILLAVILRVLANPGFSFPPEELVVFIPIYLILVPLLLVSWLMIPHHAMVKARDRVIQPYAERIRNAIRETTPPAEQEAVSPAADITKTIEDGTERITALKQRIELLQGMYPTWPLNIVQVRRLTATLSISAILSALPSIIDIVNKIKIPH